MSFVVALLVVILSLCSVYIRRSLYKRQRRNRGFSNFVATASFEGNRESIKLKQQYKRSSIVDQVRLETGSVCSV